MRNHKSRWKARRTWREIERSDRAAYAREGMPLRLSLERKYGTKDFIFLHSQGMRNSYITKMAAL